MTNTNRAAVTEFSAIEYLQLMPTDILTAFVRGDLDALTVIRKELASRGLDATTGTWIGFPAAAAQAAK